jgi:hypothetical protein
MPPAPSKRASRKRRERLAARWASISVTAAYPLRGCPNQRVLPSHLGFEISECGSLLPLFLPLTRQWWLYRRIELRRGKAATSRRTPKPMTAVCGFSTVAKYTSRGVQEQLRATKPKRRFLCASAVKTVFLPCRRRKRRRPCTFTVNPAARTSPVRLSVESGENMN